MSGMNNDLHKKKDPDPSRFTVRGQGPFASGGLIQFIPGRLFGVIEKRATRASEKRAVRASEKRATFQFIPISAHSFSYRAFSCSLTSLVGSARV